jgi:hypothetical protein
MKYISAQVANRTTMRSIPCASQRRPGMIAFLAFNRLYLRLGRYE